MSVPSSSALAKGGVFVTMRVSWSANIIFQLNAGSFKSAGTAVQGITSSGGLKVCVANQEKACCIKLWWKVRNSFFSVRLSGYFIEAYLSICRQESSSK